MPGTADPILNSKKNKLAKAYLMALTAKLNYTAQESTSDFDAIAIDYFINNHLVGEKRSVASESQTINIQLKAVSITSTSMIRKSDGFIEYNLTDPLQPVGPNFYLIVVELLGDDVIDTWIEHCEENIMLKKCAYYLKITEPLPSGFVKIPINNILTPDTFPTLFLSSANKEDLI